MRIAAPIQSCIDPPNLLALQPWWWEIRGWELRGCWNQRAVLRLFPRRSWMLTRTSLPSVPAGEQNVASPK